MCTVYGVEADEVEAKLGKDVAGEALGEDVARQLGAGEGVGSGVGYLTFADVAIAIANGDFEGRGACMACAAGDANSIVAEFFE